MKGRGMDIQGDSHFSKTISGQDDLIVVFLEFGAGEWNMKGLGIGNQLYGAGLASFRPVDRGDERKCLLI